MEQELEQGSEVHTAQPVISRRNRLFRYHAATTGVILLVAVILHSKHAEKGCTSELNDGQWVEEGVWHTNNCTLHHFQTSEMEACVSQFSHVIAIGAEKWADAANLLCPITRAKGKKDSVGVQETTNAHSCTQEYISQSNTCAAGDHVVQEYIKLAESRDGDPVLVIHQPLFHMSTNQAADSEPLSACRGAILAQLNAQQKLLTARPGSLVVQLDPNPAWRPLDGTGTDATMVFKKIYSSAERNTTGLLYLTAAFETGFTRRTFVQNEEHPPSVPPELSLVLNTFCVSPLLSSPYSCCVHPSQSHYFTITILVFILAMYLGLGLILLSGATFALIPHLEAVNFDLERFLSVLHSIGGGAFILFYILMADGVGYFPSVEQGYSLTLFLVCVLVVVAVAALSCKKTDTAEFLSRDKCNAWRGEMILFYIALHYCNMDEAVAGRLFGDLLLGGLLFVSGYTHFTHYWIHADFSWKRLATVVFRLNILPVLLSLTLGRSYGAYNLPVLLTLGFLFTSAFMASWPQMTPLSMQGMGVQGPQHVVVVVKFGFAFLVISFLPWVKGVIDGVVSLPVLSSLLQSHTESTDSLYHWIYTQRFMTLGGMVFGYVLCNIQSNSSAAIEGFRRLKMVTAGFSVAIVLGYGMFLVSAKDFSWSTESQSLIAVPVLLSYGLLRYFSEPLLRYNSSVLTELGSSAVWLFVSYQHILLSQSGSATLVLIPCLPHLVNSVLVLCVFFFCQNLMYFAQQTLTHYVSHTSSATPPGPQSRTPPLPV